MKIYTLLVVLVYSLTHSLAHSTNMHSVSVSLCLSLSLSLSLFVSLSLSLSVSLRPCLYLSPCLVLTQSPRMPPQLKRLKPITFCEALLVALDLDGGRDFQMGLTKVFFRPGCLSAMDKLAVSTPENVDFIVKKVRLWLARKRFFAAGYSIIAIHRIMANVEKRRAFHRFRTAANVYVRIVQCVKPWIKRVRKKLSSDEASLPYKH